MGAISKALSFDRPGQIRETPFLVSLQILVQNCQNSL